MADSGPQTQQGHRAPRLGAEISWGLKTAHRLRDKSTHSSKCLAEQARWHDLAVPRVGPGTWCPKPGLQAECLQGPLRAPWNQHVLLCPSQEGGHPASSRNLLPSLRGDPGQLWVQPELMTGTTRRSAPPSLPLQRGLRPAQWVFLIPCRRLPHPPPVQASLGVWRCSWEPPNPGPSRPARQHWLCLATIWSWPWRELRVSMASPPCWDRAGSTVAPTPGLAGGSEGMRVKGTQGLPAEAPSTGLGSLDSKTGS